MQVFHRIHVRFTPPLRQALGLDDGTVLGGWVAEGPDADPGLVYLKTPLYSALDVRLARYLFENDRPYAEDFFDPVERIEELPDGTMVSAFRDAGRWVERQGAERAPVPVGLG